MKTRSLLDIYLRVKDNKSVFILPGPETIAVTAVFDALTSSVNNNEKLVSELDHALLRLSNAHDEVAELEGVEEELELELDDVCEVRDQLRDRAQLAESTLKNARAQLDDAIEKNERLSHSREGWMKLAGRLAGERDDLEDKLAYWMKVAEDLKLAKPLGVGDRITIEDQEHPQYKKVGTIITPSSCERKTEFTVQIIGSDDPEVGRGDVWFVDRDKVARF